MGENAQINGLLDLNHSHGNWYPLSKKYHDLVTKPCGPKPTEQRSWELSNWISLIAAHQPVFCHYHECLAFQCDSIWCVKTILLPVSVVCSGLGKKHQRRETKEIKIEIRRIKKSTQLFSHILFLLMQFCVFSWQCALFSSSQVWPITQFYCVCFL